MKRKQKADPLRILLADDDSDDRFFFEKALKKLSIPTTLKMVANGEQLMNYLLKNCDQLPDVLFLDLNMPRKNGSQCLEEIKSNKQLKHLPVVIYSTSLNNDIAEIFFEKGAHYYLKKSDYNDLLVSLENILTTMKQNNFNRPSRDEFVICLVNI